MKSDSFECPFATCKKLYTTKYNLNKHIELVHWGVKAFKCTHCGKALATKQNLTQHVYTHTGETPFVCREAGCGEQFRYGSQLSIHKKFHRALTTHRISSPSLPSETGEYLPLPPLPEIRLCNPAPNSPAISEGVPLPTLQSDLKSGQFLPRLFPNF